MNEKYLIVSKNPKNFLKDNTYIDLQYKKYLIDKICSKVENSDIQIKGIVKGKEKNYIYPLHNISQITNELIYMLLEEYPRNYYYKFVYNNYLSTFNNDLLKISKDINNIGAYKDKNIFYIKPYIDFNLKDLSLDCRAITAISPENIIYNPRAIFNIYPDCKYKTNDKYKDFNAFITNSSSYETIDTIQEIDTKLATYLNRSHNFIAPNSRITINFKNSKLETFNIKELNGHNILISFSILQKNPKYELNIDTLKIHNSMTINSSFSKLCKGSIHIKELDLTENKNKIFITLSTLKEFTIDNIKGDINNLCIFNKDVDLLKLPNNINKEDIQNTNIFKNKNIFLDKDLINLTDKKTAKLLVLNYKGNIANKVKDADIVISDGNITIDISSNYMEAINLNKTILSSEQFVKYSQFLEKV